jgi:hypothetical protein
MKSVISRIVNKDWNECVSIWSMEYLRRMNKKQIICILQRNHTKEDWEYIMSLTQDELLFALENAIKNNPLHVLYPN